MGEIHLVAPDGVGEVTEGTDLTRMVSDLVELRDGDVVVVTSKVVSKAEGRTVTVGTGEAAEEAYAEHLAAETVRVVARRGPTRIVRNRLGLVMAAAGIDRSNTEVGTLVLLPLDPDATARQLRSDWHATTGANVGVVVTDTAGRAWREGQTDIAVGAAGLHPAEEFAGRTDSYGNPLAVTLPAVADEIAGAAELAQGKLGGRPFAVLRGRGDLVLPVGDHGPGAAVLQRPEGADLFGLGAREAVVAALSDDAALHRVFGAPAAPAELAEALTRVLPTAVTTVEDAVVTLRTDVVVPTDVLRALAVSHGWSCGAPAAEMVTSARFSPDHP